MPYVFSKYTRTLVLCPLKHKQVEIRECYTCPYYLFRNGNYLACKYELERLFGKGAEIVSKEPLKVRDAEGNIWKWNRNERKEWEWIKVTEKKNLSQEQ